MMYAMRLALAAFLALGAQGCSKQEKPQDEQQREPRQEDAAAQPPGAARPVQPKPRIVEIAAGEAHTCVRTDQGTVRCWGKGAHGRLGYGNTKTIGDDEPASAGGDVELGGKAVQITAGDEHTCALLQGGAVRCWGNGDLGRLGYGNTKTIGDDETPASAGDVPVGAAVRQIEAGGRNTCAVLESGHLRCWGEGQENRLGYGSWDNIGDDETPSVAGDVPLGSLAQQVALGYAPACALLQSKAVRCWGPRWGHAETSDWEPRRLPDVKLGGSVRRISAGGVHTCALMGSGSIRCWGDGSYGRLGYPGVIFVNEHGKMFRSTFVDDHGKSTPARMGDVDIGGQVIALSAGQEHTCAILDGGVVRCWGHGRFGKLGYADDKDIGEFEPPRAAGDVNIGGRVVAVEAGDFHTCAILDTGAVRCWGDGVDGQLGYGNKRVVGATDVPAAAGDVPVF